MKCVNEELKAQITDVLVGEAAASVKEKVLLHLETCPSCAEDRDRLALVLGLLKDAPPWTTAGEGASIAEMAEGLSVSQRQKLQSLAGRRAGGPGSLGTRTASTSWLALAASLSAVGIALVLARQMSENSVEAPAPPAAKSVLNQLPQAPEGPMLPKPSATFVPESVVSPAASRDASRPGVKVAPEALRELRQMEAEQGPPLGQAAEENDLKRLKKDKEASLRDESPLSGGVAGGVVGGTLGVQPSAAPPPASLPREEKAIASEGFDAAAQAPPLGDRRSALAEGAKGRANPPSPRDLESGRRDDPSANVRRNQPLSPPRDMFFEGKGTNPFIVTEEDPQATFGLDVDTASYTITRNYLGRGQLPPASAVRVEEFVNAFPNNVLAERASEGGSAFAVRVDGAPNPLHPGYHIIRVALKAREVDPRERKAARLTFVIDVSGSMAAENRLGLVKRSLALLIDKLDERDSIGIVVYGTTGRRLLAPTSVGNRERIMSVIDRLRPEGSTNLQEGLDLGYEMARESFARGASNRVVLCTDGVANTGETEADGLLARIRSEAKSGIDMMALGFGMGNYNDALLQRLADEGNGQYAYLDDVEEARAFFLRKLTSVLEVVARDAKAQVEFNPARVERYRLLGYEKRDVADRDFRNDAVDAGEINSGHSVTALFEVKLQGGASAGKIGTARIRYKTGPKSPGVEFSREIADEAMSRSFGQATPAFRTAYVAARFAEHLRKSYWVKDDSLVALQPLADELPEAPPASELADLIRRAVRLQKVDPREEW